MAVEKFVDAGIFFAGRNHTGQSNQLTLTRTAAMLDTSVFGVSTHVYSPGLDELTASVSGWWTVSATGGVIDNEFSQHVGSIGYPLTLYPKNADLGVAYMFPAVVGTFNTFGTFGEIAPFNAEFSFAQYATSGVRQQCRGVIGLQHTARTAATGEGSGIQLGAPTATQYLVFCVHVTATDSSDLTFVLESDDNAGFTTATSRITSGSLTGGAGGQYFYGQLLGPLTDDYFRVSWTRTGGTTFTALATFGLYEPRGLSA